MELPVIWGAMALIWHLYNDGIINHMYICNNYINDGVKTLISSYMNAQQVAQLYAVCNQYTDAN